MPSFELAVPGEGLYIEKKSKFLGAIASVSSEEEAAAFVTAKKKEHYQARHNCWAYVLQGEHGLLSRFSDDGEPSGTAGKPILDVLSGAGVVGVVLVVTRYFGGVLLGTGGLTRAYSAAAKDTLAHSQLLERVRGFRFTITTDYNGYGKIEYLLRQEEIPLCDTIYAADVQILCAVPEEKAQGLMKKITNETAGAAQIEQSAPLYYGLQEGHVQFL